MQGQGQGQGQGLNRYREQLRNHETSQGHNPGRLNLDGWRDVKKAELKRLYRRGKVSVQLALRFNATMGDHVAMLEACGTNERWNERLLELGEAGVNLVRLETHAQRKASRQADHGAKVEQAKHDAKPRVAVVVKRVGQVPTCRLTGKAQAKPTLQQLLVAEALANAILRTKAKKANGARAKKGFDVKVTADLEAQLLARHASRIVIR